MTRNSVGYISVYTGGIRPKSYACVCISQWNNMDAGSTANVPRPTHDNAIIY